jgi:two-component system nitrate/nitrite response regulator NarL
VCNQSEIGSDVSRTINIETAQEWRMSLVRILIVDDFDLWTGFVITRLKERPDLHIVGFASDGLQAVQQAKELQPDVILLDMMLPKMNGIEAALEIRRVAPTSKILFVSGESELELVRAAFRVGGSGYVWKMEAAAGLLAGIDTVLRGDWFVSPGLGNLGNVTDAQHSGLDDEETAT